MNNAMQYAWQCIKYGFLRSATYRAAWFAAAAASLIQIVIMISVWLALTTGQTTAYDGAQLVRYSIFATFLWSAISTWIVRDIENDVREGRIERLLVRPVSIPLTYVCTGLGKASFNISLNLIPLALVVWFWQPEAFESLSVPQAGFVLVTFILSVTIYLLIDLCVGLSSFWTVTTFGFDIIKENVVRLLSGATVPLFLYPDALQSVLLSLPFALIFFHPANAFARNAPPVDFAQIAAGQLLCICLLIGAALGMTRLVRRHIAIAGG